MSSSYRFISSRLVYRAHAMSWVVIAVCLFYFCACAVQLVRFNVPQTVLAGATFEVSIVGQAGTPSPVPANSSDAVAVVFQLPNDIVLVDAVAGNGTQILPTTRDLAPVLSVYTPEPGHYLASISSIPGTSAPVSLRARLTAPITPGVRTLKAALASTQSGMWTPMVPAGVTNFALITSGDLTKQVTVTTDPVVAPVWTLNTDGLGVTNPTIAGPSTGPYDIDVADFDVDGRIDLLAGPVDIGGGVLFPNIYAGRFVAGWSQSLPAPSLPGRARSGDFNGDGRVDVVVGRRVFLRTMNGSLLSTFTLPVPPSVPNPSSPVVGLDVGDVDGDGFDDIVSSQGQLQVFRSLGNGSFVSANTGLPTVPTQNLVPALKLVDLDADGDLDIILGGSGNPIQPTGTIIEIYFNSGVGTWTGYSNTPFNGGTIIQGIGVEDLNGDGLPDLLIGRMDGGVGGAIGSGFTVHRATAPGIWASSAASIVASVGVFTGFDAEDVDGDGLVDIIAVQSTKNFSSIPVTFGRVRIYKQFPGGAFSETPALETGLMDDVFDVSGELLVRDVDGDGLRDIVVVSDAGVTIYARTGARRTAVVGNLGATLPGGPFPTLSVNGSIGDPSTRGIQIGLGQALTISMAQSPTLPFPSRCVTWGRLGLPVEAHAFPSVIDTFAFAPHLAVPNDPLSFTLVNSFIPNDPLSIIPIASPGAFSFTLPAGVPFPLIFSLEGMIDDGSAPLGIARTNAVFVEVM